MRGFFLGALALAAGCSFDGSTGAGEPSAVSADATASRSADANAGARADANAGDANDAVPMWSVIETLTIDSANSQPTFSQQALQSGVVYRLRASGILSNVIDPFEGDADYFDFSNPKDNGCCEDIGLGIDDTIVDDLDTQPDWGPYNSAHVYEVEWTGDGTTISALFQDTFYGNNIGSLTLEILAFQ